MTLQLFFNDLSIASDECALHVALDRLAALVATLRAVGKVSARFVINADRQFADIALGHSHPLASLRNEDAATDHRTYLKTIVDRSPWTQALAALPPDDFGGPDYRLPAAAPTQPGARAVALGLAHDLAGLAISLISHEHWQAPTVAVVRTILDEEEREQVEQVDAPNASDPAHVNGHAERLRSTLAPAIADGAKLWARRAELFPNLRFVPSVRKSIEKLAPGDPNFDGAVERLTELDATVGEWRRDATAHPTFPFHVSPESRSRLNEGLVDIKDANGFTRTFSDHARYGPDENRIHFILETDPVRHALVGHVGRKLGIG